MSAQPLPDPHDVATEEDPRLNAYLFSLLDAGEIVLQSVVRQAERQAQPTPEGQPPHPIIDVAEQFERVARATRRTILLIRHIAQRRAAADASRQDPARQRTEARKRIIREVEDTIQRHARTKAETLPLRAEFRERLDAPDLDDDILHRPIPDIIQDICRDLGLESDHLRHPYQRRTPRNVQALNALAATSRPPGPYDPAPHGPDPGAPKPKHPPPPADPEKDFQDGIKLAKHLTGA